MVGGRRVHTVSQTAEGRTDESMLVGEVGGASVKTQALGEGNKTCANVFQLPDETSSIEGQKKVKVYQMDQTPELASALRAFHSSEGETCWMAEKNKQT